MIEMSVIVCLVAFLCEWIDASLGMGFGTILSPLLILMGFPPLLVVPSILVAQAVGGITAAFFHHNQGNVHFAFHSKNPIFILKKLREHGIVESFRRGLSADLKVVSVITFLGMLATVLAAFVAVNIPKIVLSTYIGILVFGMGLFMLSGITVVYSLKKMFLVGIVSSFNKGLSGGGFGPVVTGGQMVLGQDHKKAIGCTTAAEFPICITAFAIYLVTTGISDWNLPLSLGAGAVLGGIIGPFTTRLINKRFLKIVVASVLLLLGALTLLTTYGVMPVRMSL